METVLTAFIVITLLMFAALTLFQGFLDTQDAMQESWQEMEERLEDQARTTLTPVNAEVKSAGSVVELTLRNEGMTRLSDFDSWDVVMHYYSATTTYYISWFPYVDYEPVSNEWTVVGIYMDTAASLPEVYEPGILNPGEELLIRVKVIPAIGVSTTNFATIATDNGVVASAIFSR